MKNKIGYYGYLIFIILALQLISCQKKIDKIDVTIIDDVVLGKNSETFDNYLDSLGISKKVFYTDINQFYDENQDFNKLKINDYYTKQFDLPQYKDAHNKVCHYGLYQSVTWAESMKICGLIIIFGTTTNPILITKKGFENLTDLTGIEGVNESIYIVFVNDIIKIILKK